MNFSLRSHGAIPWRWIVFLSGSTAAAQVDWLQVSPRRPDGQCLAAFDTARTRLVVTHADADRTAPVLPVHEWDGTRWRTFTPATGPAPRFDAKVAYDLVRGMVILFGGALPGGETNDHWEWDGSQWTARNLSVRPPPRQQHVMATDPVRRRIVLYGGVNRADTWEWDGSAWTSMSPATSPGIRANAAMGYVAASGRMVLFGGRNAPQDTWEWDGTGWTLRNPAGPAPASRFGHSMTASPNGSAVLLGGALSVGGVASDLWEWNGTSWRLAATDTERYGMGAAASAGAAWFVGGFQAFQATDDHLSWDGASLTRMAPAAEPTDSSRAAATYDSGRGTPLVVEGSQATVRTWTLGATGWRSVAGGVSGPREAAGLAHDPTRAGAILHGGRRPNASSGSDVHADTWSWDGSAWSAVAGPGPGPVFDHGMAWHPLRQRVYLAGGQVPLTQFPGGFINHLQTWSFDTSWHLEPISIAPGVPFGARTELLFDPDRNELLAFVFMSLAGTTTLTVAVLRSQWVDLGVAPKGVNGGAAVAWDALRRRIVLTDPLFSETWDLEGVVWTQRATAHGYTARQGHWMVQWPAGGLLLGGGRLTTGAQATGLYALSPTHVARFAAYAPGCAGAAGIPSFSAATVPWLGSTWSRELRGAPSATAAVVLLGFSSTRLANGTPLPLDLSTLGMTNCLLASSADLLFAAPTNQGAATFTLAIPAAGSLLGVTWFEQGLLVEPGANPAGAVLSGAARVVLGGR